MKSKHMLVIRADRTVRIAKKPRIAADEIGIPVILDFPDGWGKVATDATITVILPDFTPTVTQGEAS